MTITELFITWLPLLVVILVMVVLTKKGGLLEVREHRKRLEALLERIAVAVEKRLIPDRAAAATDRQPLRK